MGLELCDHPRRKAAPCGVESPPRLQGRRGALAGGPTAKHRAAHRAACPGLLIPAKPLLIEKQPPVGPSQQGPGEKNVLDNYHVT